ncbi:N-acetylmuramoyl-L-alanine amidase family protein [Robiginitalea sediminis]|uniref:N-acetylmuramoyl-L-alanine amidase family protein n=1 Tax=Robiginitalea sediminis TaxID=1982593 RepID=UPI0018E90C6D|nr:N-acetylmuramoyl-L-alanine amidase [Robiginitalea sediminis]
MMLPAIKGIHPKLTVLLALCFAWLTPALPQAADPVGAGAFTVVLDAGHGGHDPGNLGNGFLEKDIALRIVLEAGKVLQQTEGVKVIYTRDNDSFVDLYVRGEIANKAKADLFVSVHCDSHTSNAHGAGTFVLGLHANKQNFEIAKKENSVIYLEDNYETRYADYDINSPESVIGLTIMQEEFLDQSILLGKLMQDRFTGNLGRNDRKVKQAGFIVLHQTFMPSVLVETGFLTNKEEGRYLNSQKGQREIGQAIADAILEYRHSVRVGGPVPTLAPDPEPAVTLKEEAPEMVPVPDDPNPDPIVLENAKPDPAAAETTEVVAGVVENTRTEEAADTEVGKPETGKIVYKIQLMAVSKDPDLSPERFGGLGNLSKEAFNNVYRVLYGQTISYEHAKLLQKNAVQKGFPSAYIVAYKDGQRIPITDAMESSQ